jgi:hypothetical protein
MVATEKTRNLALTPVATKGLLTLISHFVSSSPVLAYQE